MRSTACAGGSLPPPPPPPPLPVAAHTRRLRAASQLGGEPRRRGPWAALAVCLAAGAAAATARSSGRSHAPRRPAPCRAVLPRRREALGAVREFAGMVGRAALPQLPRDLPSAHPVWGDMPVPKSNAARQALLAMLLSAGGAGPRPRGKHSCRVTAQA